MVPQPLTLFLRSGHKGTVAFFLLSICIVGGHAIETADVPSREEARQGGGWKVAVAENAQSIQTLETQVTIFEQTVQNIIQGDINISCCNKVSSLEDLVAGLDGQVEAVGTDLAALSNRVDDVQTTTSSNAARLDGNEIDIAKNSADIVAIVTGVEVLEDRVSNVAGAVESLESLGLGEETVACQRDIGALEGVTDVEGAVEGLESLGLGEVDGRLSAVENDVARLGTNVSANAADIGALENRADAAVLDRAAIGARVAAVETSTAENVGRLDLVEPRVTALEDDVTNGAASLANLSSQVSANEDSIATNAAEAAVLSSGLGVLEDRVTDVEGAVEGLESLGLGEVDGRLSAVENDVARLGTNVSANAADIGALENRVDSAVLELADFDAKFEAVNSSTMANFDRLEVLDPKVAELETLTNSLVTRISDVEDDVLILNNTSDTANGRIAGLEASTRILDSRVAALESSGPGASLSIIAGVEVTDVRVLTPDRLATITTSSCPAGHFAVSPNCYCACHEGDPQCGCNLVGFVHVANGAAISCTFRASGIVQISARTFCVDAAVSPIPPAVVKLAWDVPGTVSPFVSAEGDGTVLTKTGSDGVFTTVYANGGYTAGVVRFGFRVEAAPFWGSTPLGAADDFAVGVVEGLSQIPQRNMRWRNNWAGNIRDEEYKVVGVDGDGRLLNGWFKSADAQGQPIVISEGIYPDAGETSVLIEFELDVDNYELRVFRNGVFGAELLLFNQDDAIPGQVFYPATQVRYAATVVRLEAPLPIPFPTIPPPAAALRWLDSEPLLQLYNDGASLYLPEDDGVFLNIRTESGFITGVHRFGFVVEKAAYWGTSPLGAPDDFAIGIAEGLNQIPPRNMRWRNNWAGNIRDEEYKVVGVDGDGRLLNGWFKSADAQGQPIVMSEGIYPDPGDTSVLIELELDVENYQLRVFRNGVSRGSLSLYDYGEYVPGTVFYPVAQIRYRKALVRLTEYVQVPTPPPTPTPTPAPEVLDPYYSTGAFIVGGTTAEVQTREVFYYDAFTGEFDQLPLLPEDFQGFRGSSSIVCGNSLYVSGGAIHGGDYAGNRNIYRLDLVERDQMAWEKRHEEGAPAFNTATSDIYRLDLTAGAGMAWEKLPVTLAQPRAQHTATCVDGEIHVIGGGTGIHSGHRDTIEVYNPVEGTTTLVSNCLPGPRLDHVAVETNGLLYILGGEVSRLAYLDSTVVYDPALRTCTLAAARPRGTTSGAIGVVGDHIYTVGGWGNNGRSTKVDRFSLVTETWEEVGDIDGSGYSAMSGGVAILSPRGTGLLSFGGARGSTTVKNKVLEYDAGDNTLTNLPNEIPWEDVASGGMYFSVTGTLTEKSLAEYFTSASTSLQISADRRSISSISNDNHKSGLVGVYFSDEVREVTFRIVSTLRSSIMFGAQPMLTDDVRDNLGPNQHPGWGVLSEGKALDGKDIRIQADNVGTLELGGDIPINHEPLAPGDLVTVRVSVSSTEASIQFAINGLWSATHSMTPGYSYGIVANLMDSGDTVAIEY
eukprot:CAMPEP_0119156590 /NCGR_PEP_ID=MMETSP1310-20130426/52331_1 /TAXON_ID=464262 /ORGANISM="Genus nov. species nov., Strain RCC2339" /LENGTH=1517 /DNA_ID=CAMNT_0007149205 /DNA_START=39 /DNA_END=4593 /DNA_ORIENTATION=-